MVRALLLLTALCSTASAKTVEIKDEALGIVAYRMEIPDDWTFEGVLLRDPNCGLLPAVAYRTGSPDGTVGYQVLPQFGSHWSDDNIALTAFRQFHCKVMDVQSPGDFLTAIASAIRPDPTLGPIEPTFDAPQIQQMADTYNQRSQQAGLPGRERAAGVHSVVTYQYKGHELEENLRVVMTTFLTPTASRHTQAFTVVDITGFRAPKGHLGDVTKKYGAMIAKANYTQEWSARMQRAIADDHQRTMAHIKAQGDATAAMLKKNHDAYMAATKAGYDKHNAAERARQDAVHRSARAWTLYAGDEQLVKNPQTGQVTRVTSRGGSNGHQEQTSGDIIMSDDPNFDPNAFLRGTWTQLENVQP